MTSPRQPRDRHEHAHEAAEPYVMLSVLQELTVKALDLFDPTNPVDDFLDALATRIVAVSALCIAVPRGAPPRLEGAAGLSRAARALSLGGAREPESDLPDRPAIDWEHLELPYPELRDESLTRWVFPIAAAGEAWDRSRPSWVLVLFFSGEPRLSTAYRGLVDRLSRYLGIALVHRHVQKDLVARERLATVGEMAAMVAHEVRNPIATMVNSIAALRKLVSLEGDAGMLVGILEEEAARLNALVGDFLVFARPIRAEKDSVQIAVVIEQALGRALRASGAAPAITVERSVEPEVAGAISVDGQLLATALANLFSNSIAAMPEGGRITVSARAVPRGAGRWLEIAVADDGAGIPPEILPRISEPFFTTKANGSGLGLAIVKRIVGAHHGEVALDSALGRGTTVTVRLPLDVT